MKDLLSIAMLSMVGVIFAVFFITLGNIIARAIF